MKLLIDAGNTRTKWAWCPEPPFSMTTQFPVRILENNVWLKDESHSDVQALHAAIQEADEIWISNVAGAGWLQRVANLQCTARVMLVKAEASALGLQNNYIDPTQLGSDRWCSLVAVWQLYQQDALIVTAGTAMTIDAFSTFGEAATFLGGSIQPGLRLMWESMQQGAAQLHYAYPADDSVSETFARDSQQAMWLGCLQALTASIDAQYAKLTFEIGGRSPLLLLSGGDAERLQRYLPESLSAKTIIVDNLVLKGLACLAESTHQ